MLYYRDGTPVDDKVSLEYKSADTSVAVVDENGVVSPVGYGKTDITVSDGKNTAVCHVEVRNDNVDKYETSVYWVTFWGHGDGIRPEEYTTAIDNFIKYGITFPECRNPYDGAGNIMSPYFTYLAGKAGLCVVVNDAAITCNAEMADDPDRIVRMTDEEILACVKKYEHKAGFYGIWLRDEPTGEMFVKFPRVLHLITDYNPHVVPYLNQYPSYASFEQLPTLLNVPGDYSTFYHEIAAISGGNGRLRFLSFDHYPFRFGNLYENQGYIMLNDTRNAGLLYNATTGYYLNPWHLGTNYVQSASERYYTASVAAAYGMKNFKWFSIFGWVDEGAAQPSNPAREPVDRITLLEFAKINHDYLFTFGEHIGNSDAIEVYHTNEEPEQALLREDFVLTQLEGKDAIYSLFESLDGSGKQHVMIVNKNYTVDEVNTYKLKVKDGVTELKLLNMETGKMEALTVNADGTITIDIRSGHAALIELPDGYNAALPKTVHDNLALGKPAYISSSLSDWSVATNYASLYVTDGDLTNGGWRPADYDRSPWLEIDLKEKCEIGTVKIINPDSFWMRRARNFTVSVSVDEINYTEIVSVTEDHWNADNNTLELTFDKIDARYVRFEVKDARNNMFGEIEIYH